MTGRGAPYTLHVIIAVSPSTTLRSCGISVKLGALAASHNHTQQTLHTVFTARRYEERGITTFNYIFGSLYISNDILFMLEYYLKRWCCIGQYELINNYF